MRREGGDAKARGRRPGLVGLRHRAAFCLLVLASAFPAGLIRRCALSAPSASSTTSAVATPRWSTSSRYPKTEGGKVADFAEAFMHVSKGIRAGEALVLTPWQRQLINVLYERRADGLLRYKRSVIGLGRKNGKSLIGSVIALYGLIEGEHGAEVYSAAGDRRQARVVFDEAKWQVQQSPALSGICKLYRDAIEVPSTHSVYRVLSSDAKLQQGLNPSTVVFDVLPAESVSMTLVSVSVSVPFSALNFPAVTD